MAEYKTIKGFIVRCVASDPTVDKGQLWYNTTSSTLKFDTVAAGAWASMPACNNARGSAGSLGGSPYTGVVMMGGEPGPAAGDKTETYNGTAWTEVNDMLATRNIGIAGGTNTAGLIAGGPSTTTDLWNGTCWASDGTAPGIANTAWTGASTSDVMGAGGVTVNTSVLYNGTSWTAGATMNRATFYGGDGATAAPGTTALIFGGLFYPPSTATAVTESYNGTSWTEVDDMNTARYYAGGCGTSTAAMEVGGRGTSPSADINAVEQYDGTSWSEVGDLSNATSYANASGGQTAAIAASGLATAYTTACEEWDGAPAGVKTVTTS